MGFLRFDGGWTAFRDCDRPGRWCVLPDAPRLCRDREGVSELSLLIVEPEEAAEADQKTRGWLRIRVGWEPTEEERGRLLAALRLATGAEAALDPFPAQHVRASLSVAGRELPTVEAGTSFAEAAFALALDADEAAILRATLLLDRPALQVTLTIEHLWRLPSLQLDAWAERGAEGGVEAALAHGSAGISLVVDSELPPGLESELRSRALAAIQAFLGDPSGAARLSWRFDERGSIPSTQVLRGSLSPDWTAEQRDRHCAILRPTGGFAWRSVTVVCPRFDRPASVSALLVELRWPATGEPRLRRSLRFEAAGGSEIVGWAVEREEPAAIGLSMNVAYRDTPELRELWSRVAEDGSIVVIEPEALGVALLSVESIGWEGADCLLGSLEWTVGERSAGVTLGPETPTASLELPDPGGLPQACSLRWLRGDGTWTDPELLAISGGALYLSPPRPAPRPEALVVLASPWQPGSLREVLVAPAEGPEEPTAILSFSDPRAGARIPVPSGPWRWRVVVRSPDGAQWTGPWRAGDGPLIVARDEELVEVEVQPLLLALGGGLLQAVVDAEVRPAAVGARRTFLFDARAGAATWLLRCPTRPPAWRWRLTLITADHRRIDQDWIDGEGSVIVLTPPGSP